jgi:hypothetical protein
MQYNMCYEISVIVISGIVKDGKKETTIRISSLFIMNLKTNSDYGIHDYDFAQSLVIL